MFVHWQILILIQVLIGFVKSVGISTNVSLNSSIIPVSPPKVIYIGYVHNDTGKLLLYVIYIVYIYIYIYIIPFLF
jgi:hypothetical protein